MIDYVALVLSVIALACAAVLMHRDAKRWKKSEDKFGWGVDEFGDAKYTYPPPKTGVFSRIESIVKKHKYETEPGHRTTVAFVKDIISKAEHDAAKIRFK